MSFIKLPKHIKGNLIVDGTIEGDQIKADTISANKFTGAVEEEYLAYTANYDISAYNTYNTVLEFDFPAAEWNLFKGKHIDIKSHFQMTAGTTAARSGTFYTQVEVQVPIQFIANPISTFYADSNPESYWQRIYAIGNHTNKFASNMIHIGSYSSPTYKTYKNLHYQYDYELAELVTNGGLSSNTTGWTTVNGTLSAGYYATLAGVANSPEKARTSQQITLASPNPQTYPEPPRKFRLKFYRPGTTVDVNVYISASADPTDVLTDVGDGGDVKFNTYDQLNFVAFEFTLDKDVDDFYVIIENETAGGVSFSFDNVSIHELQGRTWVDVSAYPSNPISTSELCFSGLSAGNTVGTWVAMSNRLLSMDNNGSNNWYYSDVTEAYLGRFQKDIKCRLRMKHDISNITNVRVLHSNIHMQARIVG